jgi:single-strand DNA-binding protein
MSSGDTTLTSTGNLTADPEVRFTATGSAVAAFTVVASRRIYDQATGQWQDGDTLFLRCSAWRELADHAAESLSRGTRVIVTGRLSQRQYETTEGEMRTVYEVDVDDLGPLAEVDHHQDRQDQPGQGAAPGRRRRPLANSRTRRHSERRLRPPPF